MREVTGMRRFLPAAPTSMPDIVQPRLIWKLRLIWEFGVGPVAVRGLASDDACNSYRIVAVIVTKALFGELRLQGKRQDFEEKPLLARQLP